jgi:hypothetical protein
MHFPVIELIVVMLMFFSAKLKTPQVQAVTLVLEHPSSSSVVVREGVNPNIPSHPSSHYHDRDSTQTLPHVQTRRGFSS